MTSEIKQLREELNTKDKLIKTLESRIDNLEQTNIKNNIEITNLPPTQNENLTELFTKITKKLDINNVSESDISNIYRTRSHNPKKSSLIVSLTQFSKK